MRYCLHKRYLLKICTYTNLFCIFVNVWIIWWMNSALRVNNILPIKMRKILVIYLYKKPVAMKTRKTKRLIQLSQHGGVGPWRLRRLAGWGLWAWSFAGQGSWRWRSDTGWRTWRWLQVGLATLTTHDFICWASSPDYNGMRYKNYIYKVDLYPT